MKKLFTLAFLCLFTLNMYAQEPGEMNTDFGTDGIVVFHPSEKTKLGYFDYIYKVLVQEDGKILTIGETRLDGSNYSIFVARHNADGSLDETYGTNGYVFLKVDPLIYKSCPYDAVLSEDGLLYLAGYSYNGLNRAFILCLDENGFENEEYGEKGWVVTADGDYGGIAYEAIDLDSEGRCVVAGYYNDEVMVRRYTTGGELDATFGTDGIAIFELDSDKDSHSYAYDLKVLEDGKIIVCGDKRSGKDGQLFIWSYLMRINSDGSLDETFGDKGVSLLYAGEYAEFALSLAVQPNGKYLVGGHDELYSNTPEMPRYESFITRVNTDGTIDETFGTEGFVKIEPLQGDGRVNYSYSILAAPDGQIFGGIYSRDIATESFRAYVYNLDENGQFKEDFVGGGIMSLPKIDEELCELNLYSIALQGNDKLIVGGYIGFDLGDYTKLYLASIKVDVKNTAMRLKRVYSEDNLESYDYIYPSETSSSITCINESNSLENRSIIDSLFYDENGNITKIDYWEKIESGEWILACYIDYTYNERNLRTSRTNYNNFGDNFELGGIYRYYYDEEGRMTNWVLDFMDIEYQKGNIEYDEEGLKISETILGYNFGTSVLENLTLTEYEYDDNNNVVKISYHNWNVDKWELQEYTVKEYDEYNNCILEEKRTSENIGIVRKVYSYDTNVFPKNIFHYENPENEDPKLPSKMTNLLKSFEYYERDNNNELVYVTTYIVEYEDFIYNNEVAEITYEVTAVANPENAGVVTGAGTYNKNETVTLTATPNYGYKFVNWTENGSVVSTNPTYSFEVRENKDLVANFTLSTYTITVIVNPENAGTITGAGTYKYLQTVNIIATENEGYKFVCFKNKRHRPVFCVNENYRTPNILYL